MSRTSTTAARSAATIAIVMFVTAFDAAADPACTFTQISTYSTSCGLQPNGNVKCWGTPTLPNPPPGPFTQISIGDSHACGLREDGSVECWGQTCSIRTAPYPYSYPYFSCEDFSGPRTPPAGVFTQISAGGMTTCGLRANGRIECWGGDDTFGQKVAPAETFAQVSAGFFQTCGLTTGGEVFCWGSNAAFGSAQPPPPDTVAPVDPFTSVVAGQTHNCALRGGEAVCWGDNSAGQLNAPGGVFVAVVAGAYQSCGIREDGSAECWGQNNYGEASPPPGPFTQLSAGFRVTCGLRPDGTPECWGDPTNERTAVPECTICGNGLLGAGEQCDDGNLTDGDGCSSSCTWICGDGYLGGDEECDDGNVADDDGCDANCSISGCGNDWATASEGCDDGNAIDGDGCDSDCTVTACGNGIRTNAEECDDGDADDTDGCTADCILGCPPAPRESCGAAESSSVVIKDDDDDDAMDQIAWKWKNGVSTNWYQFTAPMYAMFDVCLYGNATLTGQILPRDGAFWSIVGRTDTGDADDFKGQRYKDRDGSVGGLTLLDIRFGDTGDANIRLKAKGVETPDGLLPATSYTVQLIDWSTGGTCWSSEFATGRSGATSFKASAP
jgi:cysteine-rich repeat protein